MSHSRRGKKLESDIGTALKVAAQWRHNSNNAIPSCDWATCYKGAGVLIECKETHQDRIDFRCVSDNERQHLDGITRAGGLGLIAVSRVYPNKSRLWLCSWPDWLHLEQTLGRASVPLLDGVRPPALREVGKLTRANSLGRCWDLSPFLESWWQDYRQRANRDFSEVVRAQTQETQKTQAAPTPAPQRPAKGRPLKADTVYQGPGFVALGIPLRGLRQWLYGVQAPSNSPHRASPRRRRRHFGQLLHSLR